MPGKVDAKNDAIAKAIFTGYNNYLLGKVDAKNDVIAKAIFTGYNNYLSGKVDAKKRCYCQGNITNAGVSIATPTCAICKICERKKFYVIKCSD